MEGGMGQAQGVRPWPWHNVSDCAAADNGEVETMRRGPTGTQRAERDLADHTGCAVLWGQTRWV